MNYVHKDDITPLECMRITELLILGSSGSDPYGPWRRIVEHKLERALRTGPVHNYERVL